MYPFPSFGTFLFKEVWDIASDTWWNRESRATFRRFLSDYPNDLSYVRPVERGNGTRGFDMTMTLARVTELQNNYQNTLNMLTDWQRPTPDSRYSWLKTVQLLPGPIQMSSRQQRLLCAGSGDNSPLVRVRLEFVEAR